MGPQRAVIPLQPSDKRSHAACARASLSRPMRACVVGHLRFRDVNEANYETLNAAATAAAPSFPPSLLPSIAIWVTLVTRRENSREQREV